MHLATDRSVSVDEPQNVRQLRRHLQPVYLSATRALEKIKAMVDAQGRGVIENDLGEHGSELSGAYTALKLLVQTLDPEAVVPDLE